MSTRTISADIVSVFTYSRGKHRAECSCGYESRLRFTKARAVLDALYHAIDTGCREDWPLIHRHRGPLPVSARRRSPWWIWTSAAGAIIGGALWFSAPANADPVDDYAAWANPVICETIAEEPYVSTVVAVVKAVAVDSGQGDEFAGAVIGTAVRDYCPWNRETVERWIALSIPAHHISGGVGGRI